MTGWSLLSETVPLYALYSLVFADTGLTDAQISALFALWSVVGLLAEIPAGVAADRFSRRAALVVAGLLSAGGFATWGLFPGFAGFAVGFALWGVGGACASGAAQAAVYDGMLAHGCAEDFGRVQGRIDAAGLVAQVPAAVAAAVLFTVGGYGAVTAASVLVCLLAAALAATIPDIRPNVGPGRRAGTGGGAGAGGSDGSARLDGAGGPHGPDGAHGPDGPHGPHGTDGSDGPHGSDGPGGPGESDGPDGPHRPGGADGPHGPSGSGGPDGPDGSGGSERARDLLRGGLLVAGSRGVAGAVAAVAVIGAVDDVEEYFPLLASRWGAGTAVVPLWVLLVPLAGAVGAVLGGRVGRLSGWGLPVGLLGAGLLLLAGAAVLDHPAGMVLVAAFYLLYRVVTVILEVGMQHRVTGPARATVGSIAEVGVALVGLTVFAAWAAGGLPAVLILLAVFTLLLPWLLRERPAPRDRVVGMTSPLPGSAGPSAETGSVPSLGTLESVPAATRPDLLAAPVAAALAGWPSASGVAVAPIDPALADTAAFCAAYGVPEAASANCVVVSGKRDGEQRWAAAVVLATTRADVNGVVRKRLDVRKVSFAPMDQAVADTGMEYGGITPIGLPAGWPVLVDAAVVAAGPVVIGSGIRGSKIVLDGAALAALPGAEVVEGLARPVAAPGANG